MNWSFLEQLPGLIAVPSVWSDHLGTACQGFRALCLAPDTWQVMSYPCPHECGCWHRVIPRHDHTGAIGTCRCTPPKCPDLILTVTDITPLKVIWTRLARELARALGLTHKYLELPPSCTVQVGSWSTDAVPVILTIQTQYEELQNVIAELGMRLQKPFILLSPTTNLLTAPCQEMLVHAHAGFFPLETTVTLTPNGTLLPARAPGELFSRFTPQPKELDEDIARRAFTLIKQLDTDQPLPPPTTMAVFRLYCIEELSVSQVARRCHCSRPTVLSRLQLIRTRTGQHPKNLRALSAHISQIESQLSDPRAKRIQRTTALDEPED